MDSPVIKVENVSKAYRIWKSPSARLKHPLLTSVSSLLPSSMVPRRFQNDANSNSNHYFRDFYALDDISFEVMKGDCLGIIGRNGAGKSTLLQIIAGTVRPTNGSVTVNGKVAALLELSAGFDPDYTGRENVFLKAALLGLSREETNAKFDQIAAFADIGDFLEEPVRTYSSGMMVRLAFAVSANVEPDVLIIDEALAVGDARFQLKCAKAIGRFRDNGVSLLFVSHSMSSVKQLCNYGMLIEGGKSIYFGKPNDVSNLYSRLIADGGTVESLEEDIKSLNLGGPSGNGGEMESEPKQSPQIPSEFNLDGDLRQLRLKVRALEKTLNDRIDSKELLSRVNALLAEEKTEKQGSGEEYSYGGQMGLISEIGILDDEGLPRTWFDSGEYALVYMNIESKEDFPEPIFAFTLKDKAGIEVYGTNTFFSGQKAFPIGTGERRRVEFRFPLNIMAGHYFISFGFTHFLGNDLTVIHRRYDAIKIDIHAKDKSFGQVNLWAEIKQSPL